MPPLCSYDREDVRMLAQWAKDRAELCAAYGLDVPEGTGPTEAAAALRSGLSCVARTIRPLLSPLVSYPFYLYDKLGRSFPVVHKTDLDQTVLRKGPMEGTLAV